MRIGQRAHAHFFWPLIRAVPLGKADEKALLRRKPVHGLQVFAFGGVFPRNVAQDLSAQIGHVFAQREPAVDVYIVHDYVLRVLVGNAFGALFEFLLVVFGPPVAQIALGIELRTLIVKAMRQLVANRSAGIAVIGRVVHSGVIQRRLPHAGGEVYVGPLWAGISIYYRGPHT